MSFKDVLTTLVKLESVASCQSVASWVSMELTLNAFAVALKLTAMFVALLVGYVIEGVLTDGVSTVVKEDGVLQLP